MTRQRIRILLFVLMACGLAAAPGAGLPAGAAAAAMASDGAIDLTRWQASGDGPIALNGTWAFYWDTFISPERFTEGAVGHSPQYVSVPGTWNGLDVDGHPIDGQGFATYRLRLRLGAPADDLGIKFLDAATTCRLYVDGHPVFIQGQPGEDRRDSTPAFTPGVVRLPPVGTDVDIVVWVSNFHHRLGGLWEPLYLGRFADLVRERESRAGHRWFLFGAILIIGIYHLGLYGSRRQEWAPLFFGLFCLAVAARSLTTGERIIMTLAPGLDWGLLQKIEYISFYVCVPLFGMVLRSLFGDICPRRLVMGIGALALALTAVVLVTPTRIFSYTMPPFQWLTLPLLICGITILVIATRRRAPGALPLLLGFAALAAAGVNDILYSRLVIQSVYLLPLGLFIFIMCQALVLSNRYADAFNTLDRQHRELETVNRELETEVADRVRAERAVKAERDTLDIITRSMGAGLVVISPDYTTIWANSVIKDLFGDVEGKACHRAFNQREGICPDCGVKDVFETGKEMVTHEQKGLDAKGTPIWSQIIATPIRREDGSVAAVLELVVPITERKQAEAALKESEERFRLMAENLRAVVWLREPEAGRFLYASPAFETLWQTPVAELLDDPRRWYDAIHPDDAERIRNSRIKQLLGEATTDEFRVVRPDGTIRWVINNTYPVIASDGTISRFVGIAEDVTRRITHRKEKEDLERRLQHARRMETIATLAGGVAHQFNNALNVILSGVSLLKMEPLSASPGARDNLERMSQSVARMTSLTGQLIAFAQEGEYKRTTLPVTEMVKRVLQLVRHTISADIVIAAEDHTDAVVLVDTAQMQMAISAILMNAAEAIGPKRTDGRIAIGAVRMRMTDTGTWHGNTVPAGAYVEITISDNGSGMDRTTLDRVFDPFFSTKFQGRGLGMAAVFGIIAHHDGLLAVDSAPGQGARVRILLPEAAPVPVPEPPATVSAAAAPPAGETILLVEDDAMVREINHTMLETIGYRVLDAGDGRAAQDLAREHADVISLVLMDIHLPDISGERLLPRLKEMLPRAKMVICSGGGADGLIEKGADGFLQKPFSLKTLADTLSEIRGAA